MAQPIDSTTPTTASHSPAHIAAHIVTPTELPVTYPARSRPRLHPGNPNRSPSLTTVPTQSPQSSQTFYYPPPATSTLPLSSSTESDGSKSIVGLVVGCSVVGLVIVTLVIFLVVRKRKKRQEARKRRLDFLEGRHPAGHFTFGGVGANSDGTAAIAASGGYGSSSVVVGAGHRQAPRKESHHSAHQQHQQAPRKESHHSAHQQHQQAPHKESHYSAHQQHQQQNQQESDDQEEQEYDPYFAHRQRQQRLQMQAAREYYAALRLQQRQIQGYFPEAQSNHYRHSQQFTPGTSVDRRSYDGSLTPAMTQITAQSSYPACAYPYPQRPTPPATRGLRRHSSPWTTSPSQHQYQQSTARIPEVGRRVSLYEKGTHNTSIDSPPAGSSHDIAETTSRSSCR